MINLEYVINMYKEDFEECYIWFNDELIEYKRFMYCYKVMDILKIFVEDETYYILEKTGIYHTVSTKNPEDSWES